MPASEQDNLSGLKCNLLPEEYRHFFVNDLSLSYIFSFDFGSAEILPFSGSNELNMLKTFTDGLYVINKNEIDINDADNKSILEIYRTDMYNRRFKNSVLSQRNTIVLEFPTINLKGIIHKNTEILPIEKLLTMKVTATLNEMGIGTLVFWLNLNGEFSFEVLSNLRDLINLNTFVDFWCGVNKKIRLNGNFTFVDIAQFLILSLTTINKSSHEINYLQQRLAQNQKIKDIYKEECDKASSELKLSYDLDFYPIYHFDFSKNPQISKKILPTFISFHKKEIRGLITGDINWQKKKSKVIEKFFSSYSFSTRDSIEWFTHPNGSIKIYSKDLETPLNTSQILITFELEIILTMKYFLYKLIHNLNYFSEKAKSSYPIRALAKLRDKEMRKLDDYYSLDFLQKDTTINRISKFKEMMNIDMILEIAEKKIDSLNTYTTTEYQEAIGFQQLLLTVIFGIFGAGNLAFVILDYGIKNQIFKLGFYWMLFITIVSMIAACIAIIIIFRRTRMQ